MNRTLLIALAFLVSMNSFAVDPQEETGEQPKQFQKLNLQNSEVITFPDSDAAKREALQNSLKMIDQSDPDTKAALKRAADQLHLKLPAQADLDQTDSGKETPAKAASTTE